MKIDIVHADALAHLRTLPACSFDAMLCDPPAGISFMNAAWDEDKGGRDEWIAWLAEIMFEAWRCLKPGAFALVWSLPRTSGWTSHALENAGFFVHNCVYHLVGNRTPKSHNVSKAIDRKRGAERVKVGTKKLGGNAAVSTKQKGGTYGVQVGTAPAIDVDVTIGGTEEARQFDGYGTSLRSLCEPWWLVQKPVVGTIAENALRFGTGVLNVEGGRIPTDGRAKMVKRGASADDGASTYGKGFNVPGYKEGVTDEGRWPANCILSADVAAELDAYVGERPATLTGRADPNARHTNPGDNRGASSFGQGNSAVYADAGGPSRYFFTAKVSTWEREFGCEGLPLHTPASMMDGRSVITGDEWCPLRTGARRNPHPTMKPIALTEYLAKLLLVPNRGAPRRLLVPFAGVGSEMIGGMRAGWEEVLGIEGDFDNRGFIAIAQARIARWKEAPFDLSVDEIRKAAGGEEEEDDRQMSIWDVIAGDENADED